MKKDDVVMAKIVTGEEIFGRYQWENGTSICLSDVLVATDMNIEGGDGPMMGLYPYNVFAEDNLHVMNMSSVTTLTKILPVVESFYENSFHYSKYLVDEQLKRIAVSNKAIFDNIMLDSMDESDISDGLNNLSLLIH